MPTPSPELCARLPIPHLRTILQCLCKPGLRLLPYIVLLAQCRTNGEGDMQSEAAILARAEQARTDGADLLALGEYVKDAGNWCPAVELYVSCALDILASTLSTTAPLSQ